MERWRYVYYEAQSGRVPVKEFIEEQDAATKRSIFAALERLAKLNVALPEPHAKKLEGRDFWELRIRVRKDACRIFYFAFAGRKFVLLHAFQKKSQKTPKRELDTAEQRMKDYKAQAKKEG